ncbi:MAG: hypothetical protein ABFS32_14760 [Bacteroidota bacterium]
MKLGKITILMAFLIAALISFEQFSYLILSEENNIILHSFANLPMESDTSEDTNEEELKEKKIIERRGNDFSDIVKILKNMGNQIYIQYPQEVHMDVLTPPPEC